MVVCWCRPPTVSVATSRPGARLNRRVGGRVGVRRERNGDSALVCIIQIKILNSYSVSSDNDYCIILYDNSNSIMTEYLFYPFAS